MLPQIAMPLYRPMASTTSTGLKQAQLRIGGKGWPLAQPPTVKSGSLSLNLDVGGFRLHQARLAQWVSGGSPSWDGDCVISNAGMRETTTVSFPQATLAGLCFPDLNSASRDPGALTLHLRSPNLRSTSVRGSSAVKFPALQPWSPGSFSVEADGLPAQWVCRVEPIVFNAPGIVAGVHMHILAKGLEGFQGWFEDFVVNGNNGSSRMRGFTITYRSLSLSPIASLSFVAGIYSLTQPPKDPTDLSVAKVSFFVERPSLSSC